MNSLGKSHHIIQEVEDGQIIADVFEEMWEQSINDEDNIIWKSANSNYSSNTTFAQSPDYSSYLPDEIFSFF